MTWRDIEAKLIEQAEAVCRHLFPAGRMEGQEYVVGDLDGHEGKSTKINLGGKRGVWRDFAGDSGGKTLLSLWMHATKAATFGAAVVDAKRWLGVIEDRPGDRVRSAVPAGRPAERPDDSAWRDVAQVWAVCQPVTEGGPVWQYLVEKRRLAAEAIAAFDVREYLVRDKWAMVFPYYATPSEEDAVVALQKAPVPAWLKLEALDRPDGKKREWTTKAPEKSLLGVQLEAEPMFRKCRHVMICEGEKDALTWASYGCAAWGVLPVSVPFGAKWKGQDKNRPSPNREWLDRSWEWLDNFESVLVQMDSDEAGQRAAADIINEIGPRRCRLVTLPEGKKDANECLMAGVSSDAMRACITNARDFAPDKILSAVNLEDEFMAWVFDRHEDAGVALPFEFPLRFRAAETSLWLGIEKSGKTTLLSYATVAAIGQGERALVCSFEVPWPDNNDKLCRQAFGGLYFDKRVLKRCATDEERANYRATAREQALLSHRWLADSLWYYAHVGIGNWRQLIEDIRWARRRLGITWVIVDNAMRLGIPKDDYAQQAEAVIALVSMAMEEGIHLHIVLHQNKSEGKKGGEGGKRSAAGAHEWLGNPHNIVEVQRDAKKAQDVADLWERRNAGQLSAMEFADELGALSNKPDGKFILHAQRNAGIESEGKQDASKYLWFLWEGQQYVDVPPGHVKHHATSWVREAKLPAPGNLPDQAPADYQRGGGSDDDFNDLTGNDNNTPK